MAEAFTAAIVASGLSKAYGRRKVLDGLSLNVEKGQTYGFLGPNGAGKSTTIRMLLGLVKAHTGSIHLLGRDVQCERRPALQNVGALVESPSFYGYLSGRENVRLFASLNRPVAQRDIDTALDAVGLLDRARDKVKTYSHGMRQRLGIAAALVPHPELVILDEPTTGMDPEALTHVRELIRTLASSQNVTVFLSSHLLHEVEQVCSHVGIISGGKLVAQGAVADLLTGRLGPVEFEIDRPDDAAAAFEKELSLPIAWKDAKRVALNLDQKQIADLNEWLVTRGFKISGIQRKHVTLEEYYMNTLRQGTGS